MKIQETNEDGGRASALALAALGWTLSEAARAERLLARTGVTPGDLRARIGEPAMQAAILRFLEAHEPDLIACADALGVAPARLASARRELEA